ncbi:MAG: hypothetical protein AVDCRST_MAG19-2662, partial [uncultured Thermomicrobiales bacterium]
WATRRGSVTRERGWSATRWAQAPRQTAGPDAATTEGG